MSNEQSCPKCGMEWRALNHPDQCECCGEWRVEVQTLPVSCVLIEPAVLEAMREALRYYASNCAWAVGAKARAAIAKLEGEKG